MACGSSWQACNSATSRMMPLAGKGVSRMARARRAPYEVGDEVTGTSYIDPEDRKRGQRPEAITGIVVQIGSGWAGVDADLAYVWVRLPSGRERKALTGDVAKTTRRVARAET
ncbi:hypothetical protein ACFW6V_14225 [Streptomyces sp. NPDC058734]|uniref:hypothetical protein n=1 Tax=Streptomyces sp. NPDC058734 TaxID=3346615 RepID=UPI00369D96C6